MKMLNRLKIKIDKELLRFTKQIDKLYSLSSLSPVLYATIKDYILREGKRIRPILFVVGYCGFAKKPAKNLYTSAISLELLHEFLLIHDDIIDKSDFRRGAPSMHTMFGAYLMKKNFKSIKFSGQDLAIIVGDIMYALAIEAFLSVKEKQKYKEKSLKQFLHAAVYTGSGEFIELIYATKELDQLTRKDIYRIYDLKTAYYTYAIPLSAGAVLAGVKNSETQKLFEYGICLGRAFQIKDDILGLFGEENIIGKSSLTDLQEAKKTILIWHAYTNSSSKNKHLIYEILHKNRINRKDLLIVRRIISETGTLKYLKKEIKRLANKSNNFLLSSRIKKSYKQLLLEYSQKILNTDLL